MKFTPVRILGINALLGHVYMVWGIAADEAPLKIDRQFPSGQLCLRPVHFLSLDSAPTLQQIGQADVS